MSLDVDNLKKLEQLHSLWLFCFISHKENEMTSSFLFAFSLARAISESVEPINDTSG